MFTGLPQIPQDVRLLRPACRNDVGYPSLESIAGRTLITVWKDDRQAAEDSKTTRVVRFYPRIAALGLGRMN